MKKIIQTPNAPAPVGPYNQAVAHNGLLYVSGQVAIDPATGQFVSGSIEEETEQVMKNLSAILEEAGSSFPNVLRCTVYVSDMNNYARINGVYARYFDEDIAPARALVEVAGLPVGANVEISLIAAIGKG